MKIIFALPPTLEKPPVDVKENKLRNIKSKITF